MTVRLCLMQRLAAGQAGSKQVTIPASLIPVARIHRAPDISSAQPLYGLHSRFSTSPALDHTLNHLQRMKVIAVHTTHRNTQHLVHLG